MGEGEDYSNIYFSLPRNIIELVDFFKLGGSGGMLPQEIFQSLRLCLVASEIL